MDYASYYLTDCMINIYILLLIWVMQILIWIMHLSIYIYIYLLLCSIPSIPRWLPDIVGIAMTRGSNGSFADQQLATGRCSHMVALNALSINLWCTYIYIYSIYNIDSSIYILFKLYIYTYIHIYIYIYIYICILIYIHVIIHLLYMNTVPPSHVCGFLNLNQQSTLRIANGNPGDLTPVPISWGKYICIYSTDWWFGTFGLFFHLLGIIIPTD